MAREPFWSVCVNGNSNGSYDPRGGLPTIWTCSLVPFDYLGGFGVAMLTFGGYGSLQGTEGAVASLFFVGVGGAVLAFFAVLARWAFEVARSIPRR